LAALTNDLIEGTIDRVLWVGHFTSKEKRSLIRALQEAKLNPYLHCWCDFQEQGVFLDTLALAPEIRFKKATVLVQMSLARTRLLEPLQLAKGAVRIEPTYPIVDKTKCDQCKRCMEDCPFDCFEADEKGFPEPDLSKCHQCGNCMGVCPLSAISLRHCTIKQLFSQIEAMGDNSFLDYDTPTVLAFLCDNNPGLAARQAMADSKPVSPNVISIGVPCAGAVNNALVADALSLGIDGVLVAGCKKGLCKSLKGNELILKRSNDLQEKLKAMMLEPERIRFINLSKDDTDEYATITSKYVADLREIGPSPLKI